MFLKKNTLIVFLVTFFVNQFNCFAQNDSLLKILNSKTQSDSVRIKVAYKLCLTYSSNNPDSCILIANEGIALSGKSVFKKFLPSLYKLKGVALVNKSKYKESLEVYFTALKIAEAQKNLKEIGALHGNIGVNFWYQKEFKTALKYHTLSLEYRLKLGDAKEISKSYNNLGIVEVDLKNYPKALEHYRAALKIKDSLNDFIGIANGNNNIGIVHEQLRQFKEAKLCYEKALEIFSQKGDKRGILVCLNNLAAVYKNMKEYSLAMISAKKGLTIAKEIDDKEDIKNAYEILASCAYNLESFKEAYDHLNNFIIVKDTLENKNAFHEMQEMEKKYQSEKKEREILLLAKDNKIKDFEIGEHKTSRNYLLLIIALVGIILVVTAFAFKKIRKQKNVLEITKIDIEEKNNVLEYQKKEIIDSINYARRIQYGLLANKDFIAQNVSDNFILFKPKDIVSGDFYWAAKMGSRFYLAVCDCTGHGVPGAFMSLLSIGFLSEAIKEYQITDPDKIFNYVRKRLIENISKENQKDGFDGVLMCIDREEKSISYVAANNFPLLYINNQLKELPVDKMPVGLGERSQDFALHQIPYSLGVQIYIYTDGFADQFGGLKEKKFKRKQLLSLISENANLSMDIQKQRLDEAFETWRGKVEQIDDVCVIGIRI